MVFVQFIFLADPSPALMSIIAFIKPYSEMKKKLLDWSINATRNAQLYTQRSYIHKNLFGFLVVVLLLLTLVIGPK